MPAPVAVLRVPKGFGGSSCAPPVPSSSPQSSCPWQDTLGSPSSLLCVLELGRRSGLDPPPHLGLPHPTGSL